MLEKITTDLETSKKLKELGFNDSESEFVYWEGKPHYYHNLPFFEIDKIGDLVTCYTLEQILSELGKDEYLSTDLTIKLRNNVNSLDYEIGAYSPSSDSWFEYERTDSNGNLETDNLATTAAKLWIKLKLNKIK